MRTIIAASSILLFMYACTNYNSDANRLTVAQVEDKYLFADQIPVKTNNGLSREDSISISRNYTDG